MANYFTNCKNETELKATYKQLVKKYHPDIYREKGNEILKEIHNQLEKAVKTAIKDRNAFFSDYINTDIAETPEELERKKELLQEAKKYTFPEGALFALYWENGLKPANHRNPLTKHNFSGWNVWTLEIKRLESGYTSCLWSTFAQYKTAKNSVKKGEKSTYLTLAIFSKQKEDNESDGPQKTKVYYKGYSVFNSEQTRTSESDEPAAIPEVKQIPMKKTSKDYQQKTLNLWQEKYQTIA